MYASIPGHIIITLIALPKQQNWGINRCAMWSEPPKPLLPPLVSQVVHAKACNFVTCQGTVRSLTSGSIACHVWFRPPFRHLSCINHSGVKRKAAPEPASKRARAPAQPAAKEGAAERVQLSRMRYKRGTGFHSGFYSEAMQKLCTCTK